MSDRTLRKGIVCVVLPLLLVGLLACNLGQVQARREGGPVVPTPGLALPNPTEAVPAQLIATLAAPEPDALARQPHSSAQVVDNTDQGFRIESGEWGSCRDGDCGGTSYGVDFRFADPTCASCQARFDFMVNEPGEYDVWTWWPWGEDRATDTRFTLIHGEGSFPVEVNQRNSGDDWFWLATLSFAGGETGSVLVDGTSTGYANADAVALTRSGTGPPPSTIAEEESALSESWDGQAGDGEPVIQYFYSEEVPGREGCHYVHWDVTDATTVYLNGESTDGSGSTELCPQGPEIYTLRAENSVGDVEQSLAMAGGFQEAALDTPVSPEGESLPESFAVADGAPSVMFLHHSCGANLIEQGSVRQRLAALGYALFDHGYNGDGLVLPDGTWTGRSFDVPDDNTNPDGLAVVFAQPLHDPPDNTFSHLMQYDVIAFKSCFPVSHIDSDAQLAEYRSHYLSIRDRMDQHPDKMFIVVTQPPEIPNDTDPQAASRARALTDWLVSDEFLGGHPNVFTFNFFDLLSDPATNMLRPEYQMDAYDAHPNEVANRTIGPLFSDFIDTSWKTYRSGS